MSDYERETHTSTPDGAAYERERTTVNDTDRPVVVQRSSGAGAWILAALVAVIAIIAVVWMMNSRTTPTNDEIAAAMDSSRAAGYVEGASTALSSVPPVQTPVIDTSGAAIAAQAAAERTADQASQAAADARAAAERAADSANSAAANLSTTTPSTTTTTTSNTTTP